MGSTGRPLQLHLKLPVVATKFSAPATGLAAQPFFARWNALGVSSESQKVVALKAKPESLAFFQELVAKGLRLAVLQVHPRAPSPGGPVARPGGPRWLTARASVAPPPRAWTRSPRTSLPRAPSHPRESRPPTGHPCSCGLRSTSRYAAGEGSRRLCRVAALTRGVGVATAPQAVQARVTVRSPLPDVSSLVLRLVADTIGVAS